MNKSVIASGIIAAVSLVGTGSPAIAQSMPEHGGRVFGLVGGSFGDGESAFLTSGGAGLRLTRTLGLDFEVLHVSDLDLSEGDFSLGRLPLIFPPPQITREASVTAFLTKMTAEFPVAGGRLIPFITGGGGVGRLLQETEFSIANISDDVREPRLGGIRDIFFPFPIPRPDDDGFENAQTGMALTVGGGVDVVLWRGLSVGADVRWMRLLADRDTLDFAHIASRVTYRF